MNKRKMWAIMLMAILMISSGSITDAAGMQDVEYDLLKETIFNLEKGYSEYYNIFNTDITLYSSQKVNGNVENNYLIEMEVVLKADTVEELDYYQGIVDYCEEAISVASKSRVKDNLLYIDKISSEQADIYEELEEYIDEKQSLIFYMKEIYPSDNEVEKEILFENGMEYVSLKEILPADHEELRENGFATMLNIDSNYGARTEELVSRQAKASYSYSMSDAVSYMLKYTSNPSSCNACGVANCNYNVDTTKYNSKYNNYADKHNDCANYVSQALCEGGIPTDTTWKAGSDTWAGVAALTRYMVSNGYWTSVQYSALQKGDIIRWKNISHIAMITSFDGVTYRYSAHTNDKRNAAISINSTSPYEYYRAG